MIRRPPRSTLSSSSAASDVYKRQRAFQPAGDRMALAGLAERSPERLLGDLAARLRRQDHVERRAPDAGRAGVVGAGRDQHGAAIAHILRDVVEIDHRQHALPRIGSKMINWNSEIFCWNSSRVGNAISDSSLIGVPSCFSCLLYTSDAADEEDSVDL